MTPTETISISQIAELVAHNGYDFTEQAPGVLRIRELHSGVSFQAALEGNILYLTVHLMTLTAAEVTTGLMGQIEDATFEATVRQTVVDMRTELAKTISSSADAMANHNRLEAEYAKYVQQSQDWLQRANQALDAGNEELAKKALARKTESDQ